jgi:hypothetical protein
MTVIQKVRLPYIPVVVTEKVKAKNLLFLPLGWRQ